MIKLCVDMTADAEAEYAELQKKYNKLLSFVKELANESVYEKYENENEISWEAFALIKEIGEL